MRPGTSCVPGREDLARTNDDGHERPGSFAPLRWLRARLSRAVGQVCARVRDAARSVIRFVLPRAARWLSAKMRSAVRLVKSVFMATIGKDRRFAFWWLAVTAAIALAIGVLVAVLVSPVAGIVAAVTVGIWMLIRLSRPARSRQRAQAHLASSVLA